MATDLILLKTLRCGRSSVRHLAVNLPKHVKSLIRSGKVKEPPNVFHRLLTLL